MNIRNAANILKEHEEKSIRILVGKRMGPQPILLVWALNSGATTEGMEMFAHDGFQGVEGFVARAMTGEEMSSRIR